MSRVTERERDFRLRLGAKLFAARQEAGFSHREIGLRMGINHSVVSRWEQGDVTMTSYNMVRLKVLFRSRGVKF